MSAPKPEEKSKEKPKGGEKAEKKASAKAGSDPVQSLGSKIAMIGKLKSKWVKKTICTIPFPALLPFKSIPIPNVKPMAIIATGCVSRKQRSISNCLGRNEWQK